MVPNDSSTSSLDSNLQTRVLDFCKSHSQEFTSELNEYVRRYLFTSRIAGLVALVLFLSGPVMALKTGHWPFVFTHVLSCFLVFAYVFLAKKFDFLNSHAAHYLDLIVKVITLESAWVFFKNSNDGALNLMAGASPTLLMIVIWTLATHAKTYKNIMQSTITTVLIIGWVLSLDYHYMTVNGAAIAIGAALGAVFNSLVFRLFRYQFYFSQQEKNLRTHAYKQLEKMLYPHQRHMIEDGFTLEETMPVGYGEACVIAFDVIESSKIKSPYARTLLQNVLKKCQTIMMENYSQSVFEANAYRIKEMGDGFLCSVGYPFKVPGNWNKEALAIKLAQQFVLIFHDEAAKLAPNEKVHCAIGIANGAIEAFYPHTTPKEYDLYGRPIILATRYESIRKELFHHIPKSTIIILQESVHQKLPQTAQHNFQSFELKNFRIRDDHEAKRLYFQVFDDNGHTYARPPSVITHLVS